MTKRRVIFLAVAGAAAALAMAPAAASGHGIALRGDIPIPTWLFAWAAAMVLVVSFVALAVLWPAPRLQSDGWRPLPDSFSRVIANPVVDIACGALGVLLLLVVLYAGFRGTATIPENFAPTFVYVGLWLLPLPLSVLFGDVFRAFNPWRAIGRALAWVATRVAGSPLPAPLEYPRRLGRWPAVAGILAFVWLELAAPGGDEPETIAIAAAIYSAITFAGMAVYGVDAWIGRAEAFSVYFNLVSRISVLERRGDRIGVRRPLSGLPQWEVLPGSVALLAVLIGTVSFDGFSAGPTWNDTFVRPMADFFEGLGFGVVRSLELTFGAGMIAVSLLAGAFYWLGILGARRAAGGLSARRLASSFIHTLAPIALVYAAAHYVSLLVFQGQSLIALASDPLGDGSDLFGTATVEIDYRIIGAETFWYLQVGFVVAGHVAALVLAHDRAVALYDDPRKATRSQSWMLAVMVGFTCLALWLLSEASKG